MESSSFLDQSCYRFIILSIFPKNQLLVSLTLFPIFLFSHFIDFALTFSPFFLLTRILNLLVFASLLYFIYLFIGWSGSSLLNGLFASCSEPGLLSRWGPWASHCSGFSCCGTRTLVCGGLQYLWFESSVIAVPRLKTTGSAAVAHGLICSLVVGSSQTRGQTLSWQADSLPLSHEGSPPCSAASSCGCLDYVSA